MNEIIVFTISVIFGVFVFVIEHLTNKKSKWSFKDNE